MAAVILALTTAGLVLGAPINETYPLSTTPGTEPWNNIEPLQQRLAYIDVNSIAVSWNTYTPLKDEEAVVYYGTDPMNLDRIATSRQTTFETSRTHSHHAVLTGLDPKTEYHYRVAHHNCFACATLPTYTFKTPRVPGDEEAYSIALVGDMGLMGPNGLSNTTGVGASGVLTSDETHTIQSLAQSLDAFDHIIHAGDLAYADYFLKESTQNFFGAENAIVNKTQVVEGYEQLNEEFYDQLTPLTSTKPYMVAVGNHESNCDNGGVKDKVNGITYTADFCMPGQTNFTAYEEHWNMPGKPGRTQNFWYSYNDGLVHYIILNFETDFGQGIFGPDEVGGKGKQMSGPRGAVNEQVDWLKADLAAIDRAKTPWVVAVGHRPWYVGIDDARCVECQQAFEPILYEGDVDIVFTGHDHVFSRSWPVYNFTVEQHGYDNPRAPVYITNGLGGHYDGMDDIDKDLPADIAFGIEKVYGWSRMTFHNRTHLQHDFIAARNSSVMDTFFLYREHAVGGEGEGEGEGEGHGHGKDGKGHGKDGKDGKDGKGHGKDGKDGKGHGKDGKGEGKGNGHN